MYSVELYNRVRRACHVKGMSERSAAHHIGIDRKTVAKILKHSLPQATPRPMSTSTPNKWSTMPPERGPFLLWD